MQLEMDKIKDGTEVTITCPECDPRMVRLVVRTNRDTEEQFLGCPNWPDCKHTQPLPQRVRMRLLGHPTLF